MRELPASWHDAFYDLESPINDLHGASILADQAVEQMLKSSFKKGDPISAEYKLFALTPEQVIALGYAVNVTKNLAADLSRVHTQYHNAAVAADRKGGKNANQG